ncbi:MAG: thioredoxin-like domain-containing protein, partial [Bdellovibrionota bacterium]
MQAPEFPEKATWLGTSEPLSLAGLEGHVVLLDFWTYCCINCMHVLPVLDRLEKELENEPFHVIGVHAAKFDQEKDAANIQRAMRRHGVRHPCLVDSDHDLWKQYGVRAWPTLVLVGTSGEIVETLPGEPHFDDMLGRIRKLLEASRASGTLAKKKKQIPAPAPEKDSLLSYPGK